MSFSAGSITGTIELNTNPFRNGMLQAESIIRIFPNLVSSFMGGPLIGVANLLKDISSGIKSAFTGIIDIVTDVGHHAHEMALEAQTAGVSINFLTAMGHIAKESGSDVMGLAESLKFLNRNLADAANGNAELMHLFQQLGISVFDAHGKIANTESTFFKLADALKSIESPSFRVKVAMDLLSRGGAQMVNTLSRGSSEMRSMMNEFDMLGATMDDSMGENGTKFTKLGLYWDAGIEGIKNAIAKPFLQGVADHYDELKDTIFKGSTMIRKGIEFAFQWLIQHGPSIRDIVKSIGIWIRWLFDPTVGKVKEWGKEAFEWVKKNGPDIAHTIKTIAIATRNLGIFIGKVAWPAFTGGLLAIATQAAATEKALLSLIKTMLALAMPIGKPVAGAVGPMLPTLPSMAQLGSIYGAYVTNNYRAPAGGGGGPTTRPATSPTALPAINIMYDSKSHAHYLGKLIDASLQKIVARDKSAALIQMTTKVKDSMKL